MTVCQSQTGSSASSGPQAVGERHRNRGHRLIFVGGAPRSGTTLVQNILDCHPQICGGPVFVHVHSIMQLRSSLHSAVDLGWIDAFCSREQVDERIADLIERLLLPLADEHRCRFLSEKTSANVLVFPELLELFPAAHFVRVVRDPRAVIASMLRVGARAREQGRAAPDFTDSLAAAIALTRQRFEAGFAASRLAPARVFAVVYERLVQDPESETRRLCEFLGLEWCRDMITPSRKRHPGEKIIADSIWYADRQAYYRDPAPDRIDSWRASLGAIDQARIAAAFCDDRQVAEFGYDIRCGRLDRVLSALGTVMGSAARMGRTCLRGISAATRPPNRRLPAHVAPPP